MFYRDDGAVLGVDGGDGIGERVDDFVFGQFCVKMDGDVKEDVGVAFAEDHAEVVYGKVGIERLDCFGYFYFEQRR